MDKSFWKTIHHTVKRFDKLNPVFRFVVGLGLIILGIIGIILPIMPGWIFLIPGLFLAFPFTKEWFDRK